MTKIALIGAGSTQFARRLIADLLSWPSLRDCHLALVDINPEPLELMHALAQATSRKAGADATVTAHTDREPALDGADYVVTTIAVGGFRGRDRPEVTIPERYGIHHSVADTLGVGGVFRFLRTAPTMLEIGRDMRRLCPDSLWLNYVNPMNMLMWTIGAVLPEQRAVGLCHSVQGTADKLAGFVGAEKDRVAYWVAGINHQAWFLRLRRGTYRGEDLYPRLWRALDDPAVYDRDRVRFEVLRRFGAFVTESSWHMSEYVPWFRRTAEAIERYAPMPTRPMGPARYAQVWESIGRQVAGTEEIDLTRSREYCSFIINAVETNTPFRFNGNVPNTGLITNLPPGCNVEVPIYADSAGLHPAYVGDLPAPLAAINRTNVNVQELAVQGFLKRDRDAVLQACAVDPLASTSVRWEDLKPMVDELFDASARWVDGYAWTLPSSREETGGAERSGGRNATR
ncbi:MAG TPA: alpha-galactosidase [Chloroflexota bacterium]|nr:alpha-galactosidase [Chloroflexota bacterium]